MEARWSTKQPSDLGQIFRYNHSRQKLLFKSEKFYNIVHVYYILGLKIGIMQIPY